MGRLSIRREDSLILRKMEKATLGLMMTAVEAMMAGEEGEERAFLQTASIHYIALPPATPFSTVLLLS